MKKILGMAGLLIAAVIFAYTFRLKTVGYLDTSVMAVTDRQMTGTLKAGIGEHEDRRLLTLQNYQAAEPLYSRGNRYYLGKERTQLDILCKFRNLPVFYDRPDKTDHQRFCCVRFL